MLASKSGVVEYKIKKNGFCVTLVAATCLFLLSKSLSFNTNYTKLEELDIVNFTKKMRLIKSISHRHRGRCTNFTNL